MKAAPEASLLKTLADLLVRAHPGTVALGLAAVGLLLILAAAMFAIVSWE